MRYLLIVLGIVFLVLGFSACAANAGEVASGLFVATAIFISIGSATCDIVNAIKPKPEKQNEDQKLK